MRILIFILITWLSCNTLAAPCEQMQLQVQPSNVDLSNNPNTSATIVVKADTRDGGCDFFLTFDYGTASSFNNRKLDHGSFTWPMQISKNSSHTQVLKNFPDVSSNNDVLNNSLPGGNNGAQRTLTYWMQVDQTDMWRKAGNYTGNFTVRLYRGTIASYTFIDSRQISANYNAPKKADISVIPTGQPFSITDTTETLNFGPLSTGDTKSADIRIKTNAGYSLYASSANNGALKHLLLNSYVSYVAKFDGVTINLSGSAANPKLVMQENGDSPANGFLVPASITIGSTAGAQSGSYSDTITLTIQTRN